MQVQAVPQINVAECAARLAAAREADRFLGAPSEQAGPKDLSEAYGIQESVHAIRADTIAAYKIGLTNVTAQHVMGAREPIAGRLVASDLRHSPAKIRVASSHLKIVEAEFVFEIGKDLGPLGRPYALPDIVEAISGIYAGIEVCNSRFGPEDISLPWLVADNSNADLLVIGDKLDGVRPTDLVDMSVTLTRQGKPTTQGCGANVLENPLVSAMWLANWLAVRGQWLRSGVFIASGSCTGMTELDLGKLAVATFGERAQAQVEFV